MVRDKAGKKIVALRFQLGEEEKMTTWRRVNVETMLDLNFGFRINPKVGGIWGGENCLKT